MWMIETEAADQVVAVPAPSVATAAFKEWENFDWNDDWLLACFGLWL